MAPGPGRPAGRDGQRPVMELNAMFRFRPTGQRTLLAGSFLLVSIVSSVCREVPAPGPRREVRDGLGREVSVPRLPQRLVSLAPSVTEALFALGFGERLVGVSEFCEVPSGVGAIARIGGLLNPNLETIRALRPDLLIGTTSGNDPALAAQSEGLGLPLYIVHTPDIERLLGGLEALADTLGERGRGTDLVRSLRARLARVAQRIAGRPRPRVLFIVWSEPLIVPGRPAFLTDALQRAGALSVTADAPAAHPAFNLESLVARAPQVILTTDENRDLIDRLADDPAWAAVPAVRDGRVHVLSGAIVRPGPGIVAGIEEVARLLHAEAFEPVTADDPDPARASTGHSPPRKEPCGQKTRTAGGSGSGTRLPLPGNTIILPPCPPGDPGRAKVALHSCSTGQPRGCYDGARSGRT